MSASVSQPSLPLNFAVSVGDVDAWRAEIAELDTRLLEITARRERLKQRIEAAGALFALLDAPAPPTAVADAGPVAEDADESLRQAGGCASESGGSRSSGAETDENEEESNSETQQAKGPTFVSAVTEGVYAAESGVVPYQLKAALLRTDLAERLTESDKGFYHAIDRLARRGVIIRYKGRLFSPDALDRFKAMVAAGLLRDEVPKPPSHSPMGDAILQIVAMKPGIGGGHIIAKLKENPEFAAALTPHSTGAFNVISRLTKRRQIVKVERGYFVPGDAPEESARAPDGRDETIMEGVAPA
jgi:hypothetical protein